MIDEPVIGKEVVIDESVCCGSGFPIGTIGLITEINIKRETCFKVESLINDQLIYFWHCKKCVSFTNKNKKEDDVLNEKLNLKMKSIFQNEEL